MRPSLTHSYLIALGSNTPHPLHGPPKKVLRAAIDALAPLGSVHKTSRLITSAPLGPARRQYANGAALLESEIGPVELLASLKQIERQFGIRRGGRWRARVLDLDIIMWSGGIWASSGLLIPHHLFRERDFVLGPASCIAGDWRDPLTGLKLRHLRARLNKKS
ncbi:2-amino-4-hydroxy-6-hydroxymethyldihydropteridine diphosphokinase [Pontixanthobacter gangjinensis]|uniref:2-amino-4-hydroxy-6-hydroxymethyldihydropteridine pyrophosphokinase n=1 Tax=Pontixanthobacter gangjinensis TaxID=1028742 RepID=A0A6I4SHU9_9SPHN|nr:2-amino-4-hydroxy-6-hydroxymethyldihydropteridine diphosphokinase [Pontixanthobacter gangjinensis]MXO55301.1 2-amino-4-hydroxy-6-hydroxymethyldihydropteridine diphosphokinase [Pontixanthobacter gangjinensis]